MYLRVGLFIDQTDKQEKKARYGSVSKHLHTGAGQGYVRCRGATYRPTATPNSTSPMWLTLL